MYKLFLAVCAQALIQSISAQCLGAFGGLGIADGCGCGWSGAPIPIGTYFDSAWSVPFCNGIGPGALAASRGSGFMVTSSSPISPTGVSMTSENAYEGLLAVSGTIPFLGAVALEGAVPTLGGGAVTYGCGNGKVAMVSEDGLAGGIAYEGFAGPFGFGGFDGFAGPYGYGRCGYDLPYAYSAGTGYNGCGGYGPWY